MLSWVKPEHFDIKRIYVNELKSAVSSLIKIDEAKSIYEKLQCVCYAHNTINNTIKFSKGYDTGAGVEEISPLFHFVIIKARPKRFFSNINYIKAFLSPVKYKCIDGFLLSQMEFAAEFILKITCEDLKMTEEEFNNNCMQMKEKLN